MNDLIFFIIVFVICYILLDSIVLPLLIGLFLTAILFGYLEMRSSDNITEGMTSKGSPKKKKGKSKNTTKLGKDVKENLKKKKFPKGKYKFDAEKTYKKTYKGMSSGQMKGLNKDTKDLLTTQNQLMSTLKEMAPVLEQGKTIMGAFDSFFGNKDKKTDIEYLKNHLEMAKKGKSEK